MYEHNVVPQAQWEVDVASSLGVTPSLLRFTTSFFLSVLVGAVFRFVPATKGRHMYALLTGFALVYYPFGNGVFHLFVPSMLTYLAMWGLREKAGKIAWLIDFTYLICCHVAGASGTAWKSGNMDFTGAQMVVTLKIISAAVCYQDGLKQAQDLNTYQQSKKLTRMPSLLEWLSYVFAAGNLLAGPTFELSDYLAYIERRGPWDPKAEGAAPSPIAAGWARFGKALACMVVHLRLVALYPVEVLESDWYYSLGIPHRIVTQVLVGMTARFKYYFAWATSEAALIFSGFAYNGSDDRGEPRWDRYNNTNIAKVELCTNPAELPVHWNTCTGNFLRQYVYERLTRKGRKASFQTLLTTQIVSGIWHGLFAGYAMFFLNSAFMFESGKVIFRYERGLGPRYEWLVKSYPWLAVKWAYTAFALNYSAAAFLILDFAAAWRVWRSVNFLGHILMVTLVVLAQVMPPAPPPKKRDQIEKQKAADPTQQPINHAGIGTTDAANGEAVKAE